MLLNLYFLAKERGESPFSFFSLNFLYLRRILKTILVFSLCVAMCREEFPDLSFDPKSISKEQRSLKTASFLLINNDSNSLIPGQSHLYNNY